MVMCRAIVDYFAHPTPPPQAALPHSPGRTFGPHDAPRPNACPVPTLYGDFLVQHEPMLRKNQRLSMQVKNLARLDDARRDAIQKQAAKSRASQGG